MPIRAWARSTRRVYAPTCERLGVLPEETVFLDDVGSCVEAARHFGIHVVLFRENTQAIAEIEQLLASV